MKISNERLGLYLREQTKALVNDGKKLQAVKLIKEATGFGLKNSKEIVDFINHEGY